MNVVGIISEYNPFHLGHKHHLETTKELLGPDCAVVSVMSGNFVQRGEPAAFAKNARAEAAVLSGVDLVLELPLPWALSSAEGFARGAVGLLGACGMVTHLSFGSECGETEPLEEAAALLSDPQLDVLIRDGLAEGMPYAAARQQAAETLSGHEMPQLRRPNDILGVEYIRALNTLGLEIRPVTILRTGAGHDSLEGGSVPSAAELRMRLSRGMDISRWVPEGTRRVLERETEQGRGPVFPETLESAVLSRLRFLDEASYSALPDAGEGLGNRLARAARTEPSLDGVVAAAKTRRYALSRLRRMTMCAALGIREGDNRGVPPYLRVLASNGTGLELLRTMKATALAPVITKPADIRELDGYAQHIFTLEAEATDLYCLGFPAAEERRAGRDWRLSPVIVR